MKCNHRWFAVLLLSMLRAFQEDFHPCVQNSTGPKTKKQTKNEGEEEEKYLWFLVHGMGYFHGYSVLPETHVQPDLLRGHCSWHIVCAPTHLCLSRRTQLSCQWQMSHCCLTAWCAYYSTCTILSVISRLHDLYDLQWHQSKKVTHDISLLNTNRLILPDKLTLLRCEYDRCYQWNTNL